ncbi:hypothetical protein QJS10_CPA06g02383 [Acorus calamus]|uniref:Uncharacterized protein n=1 Tax=Acorus calamus TaxID=4465 RepID=A0AAV9ESD8_ACOCL|nr:hypothetical protein QJS10_CPA06g02383 [Acorus calamus]
MDRPKEAREEEEEDDEELGFSRNYFLAKENSGSVKKSSCKLSDINVVDEKIQPYRGRGPEGSNIWDCDKA